jgi:DNA-binding MarR family transcriptional regulator
METLADNTVTTRIPPQLIRSDTHGKGAAEIGWGSPGDFKRCEAFARAHGIPGHMIEGFCANLHKLATGEWPGVNAHKGAHALDYLIAAMGSGFKGRPWSGPLAPIGTPTGDGRIFPPNTLKYQTFPMPFGWQEHSGRGHDGAVTVAVIEHAEERMHNGQPFIWGRGYMLDPDIIPEVRKAEHLIEHGVAGASVDLDSYTAALRPGADGKHLQTLKEGRMRSATIVRIPAFADLRLQFDDEEPETVTAAIDDIEDFSVNGTGWKGAPVAPREAEFDADDAVSRIEAWAGQDRAQLDKMFLWVNPNGDALGRDGYKLPWGDIIDGKPYLIYHAVYAAAALLSGAHGGLPNIPEEDKIRLRGVITQIYNHLAAELDDPNIQAPWDRHPSSERVAEAALVSAVGAALEEFRDMPGGHRQPRVPGVPGARRSRHIDNPHGGEFEDVPGRGPHGQVKVGNKWVYPAKGAKNPEASARAIAKKGGGKTVVAKKSDIDAEREADRKRAAHLRDVAAAGSHRPEPKEDKKPEPKPEKKAPEKKAPEKKAAPTKEPEKKAPEKKATSADALRKERDQLGEKLMKINDRLESDRRVTGDRKEALLDEHQRVSIRLEQVDRQLEDMGNAEKKAPEPTKGRGHIGEQVKAAGTHDEGRTRQHHVDRARAVAEMASAMDELDFNENTLDESKKRMASMAERFKGEPGGDDLAELNDKLQAAKTTAEMSRIANQYAESHGLSRSGRAGQVTPFDRTKHQRIGSDDHRPGEKVEIVRPGYTLNDGEKDITLRRPVVDVAVPEVDAKRVEEKVDAAEAKDPKMTDEEKLKIRRDVLGNMLEPEQKKVWDGLSDEQKDRLIDQTASAMREKEKSPGGRIAVVDAKTGKEVGGKTIVAKKEHKVTPAQQKAIDALKADPNAKIHPATRKVLEREGLIPKAEAQKPETAKPEKPAGRTVVAKGAGSDGVDDIRGKLGEVKTREEADRILAEVKGQRLKDLARSYYVSPNGPVADIRANIREHTVGSRRNSEAIRSGVKASDVSAAGASVAEKPAGKTVVARGDLTDAQQRNLEEVAAREGRGEKIEAGVIARGRSGGKGLNVTTLRRLEDRGLIERRDDEGNKVGAGTLKTSHYFLTPKGREHLGLGPEEKKPAQETPAATSEPSTKSEAPAPKAEKPAGKTVVAKATAARESRAKLAKATEVADVIAEVDEMRGSGADLDVAKGRVAGKARQYPDNAQVQALAKRLAAADSIEEMDAVARGAHAGAGLSPIGRAGETVAFDPAKHKAVGKAPAKGAKVTVVRPGHAVNEGGDQLQLSKADVATVAAPAKESQDVKEQWKKFDALQSRDKAREMIKDLPKRDLVALADEGNVPYRKSDTAQQLRNTLIRWAGASEDSNAILGSRVKRPESGPEAPSSPQTAVMAGRMSTKAKVANSWGGLRKPGDVHFHPDGAIGVAISGLGTDAGLNVDGDRLDNVLGHIATDTVAGKTTAKQQLEKLKALEAQLPAGSRAKAAVAAAVEKLSVPEGKTPELPEATPAPLKTLMRKLAQVPLAHDTDHQGSELELLSKIAHDWESGQLGKFRLISRLRDLANRRHESKEGKFEIDAAVRKAIEDVEKLDRSALEPPGKADAPGAARGSATVVAKGRAKVPVATPPSGPVITGDHGDEWHRQLPPGDTDADGVPVRDLKLSSGYVVGRGRMVRRNGTTYLIEDQPGQNHDAVVSFLDRFQSSLPHARTLQHGIAWLNGANPDDGYWAKRFGTEHVSAMTASKGKVHVWGAGTRMHPNDVEFSLRHEYGHNVDGRGPALLAKVNSEGPAWRAAIGADSHVPLPPGFVPHNVLEDGVDKKHGAGREVPDGVTDYGKSSLLEDFAESVMMYLQHEVGRVHAHGQHPNGSLPVFFRDLFPQRAALLDRVFSDIAEQQRAILRARGDLPGQQQSRHGPRNPF